MNEIERLLGLDYGDVRIGIAISDPLGKIATPLEIISRRSEQEYRPVIKRLKEIIEEYSVKKIVLGYPKQMNNIEGENCRKVLQFKELLERHIDIDIVLFDERLTTVMAKNIISYNETKRIKNNIDKFAAALILQGFLERREKMDKHLENDIFEEDDEEITTIVMVDDDGNEISFILAEIFTHKDIDYYIMFREEDGEDEDELELHIFKKIGENDDDIELEEINEDEFDEISDIVKEKIGEFDVEQ